jgi:hypothetical protein
MVFSDVCGGEVGNVCEEMAADLLAILLVPV